MKNKNLLFVITGVVLLALFAVGANFYKNYESKRLGFLAQENASLFIRDYSPQYGNPKAKIYLIEFLDPECESCRAFYPQVKSLLKEFDGKVKLIVRYAAFHKNSKFIIKALEATRKQGKYWESLELLFRYQPHWGNHQNPQPNLIFQFLPEVGVDIVKLKSDMNDPKFDEIIAQDAKDLRELNIRGTPTFFVNGKPVKFGMDYLRAAIELEINSKN